MANDAVWNRFISELLDKNDIVDVISSYIDVKPKGRGYWALCPFHNDRNPSLSINREGQYFHCFVCGVGGNAIRFIMKYESCSFIEAVETLAKRAGLEVPDRSGGDDAAYERKKKERQIHYDVCRKAARFYHASLMSEKGLAARKYLENRGIGLSAVRRFGMGYSPDWDSLNFYLKDKGFKTEDIHRAGVLNVTKNDRAYDPLSGRIIVPIVNMAGNVVAFGGRIFNGEDAAKYKNTVVTDIFDKSKNLFAINLAKKCKQEGRLKYVIIVEGYMDAISLYQAGFDMTVASMGTALTSEQARLVSRLTKDVYICYDGDKAGQAATLRGLDILKKEGLNVRVMSMPDEMDPDDLVRKRGAEAFEKALEAAVPLTDYKLECAWRESGADKVNGEEKKREAFRTFAKNAIAVLKPLDSVEQDSYLGLIRDRTGLSYDMLKRELVGGSSSETADDSGVLDGRNAVADNLLNFLTAEDRAMYFVLASCLMRKDYAAGCAVPRTDNPFFRMVADYLAECKSLGKQPVFGELYALEGIDAFSEELKRLVSVQFNDADSDAEYFADCLSELNKIRLRSQIKALSEAYEAEKDQARKTSILVELSALTRQKTDNN